MLRKEQLAGPTLAEFAASALTPEIAEALAQTVEIRDDGSMEIDFTGAASAVAATAQFFARLGVVIGYVPPRIAVDELEDQLWDVLEMVSQNARPVEIDVDGQVIHLMPGPAPSEPVDLHAIRRAVLERYDRTQHVKRVGAATDRMLERWGDVLERLGSA